MHRSKEEGDQASLSDIARAIQETHTQNARLLEQQTVLLELVQSLQKTVESLSAGSVGVSSGASHTLAPSAVGTTKPAPAAPAPEKKSDEGLSVFISYCWANSQNAKDLNEVKEVFGVTDPRQVQADLEARGIKSWLDKQQLGKRGLFEDIADGLISAKVVVAFLSDEYAKSENCCMEFQFAKKTLRIPVIPVVVGAGWNWQKTKIGLMIAGDLFIDFTDASKYGDKFEELFGRLDGLVGSNATEEKFKEAVAATAVNPTTDELKEGDGFELYWDDLDGGNLNFSSTFSKDPIKAPGTGDLLKAAYYWPVDVLETDPERPNEVYVDYKSYEGMGWATWILKSKLRPISYASVSTSSLAAGQRVEVKLAQRASTDRPYAYCWVAGTVTSLGSDSKVNVQLDAEVPNEGYFRDVTVKRSAIKML
eukprot:c21080_g1_i1.p1 GENE.c21080_g1_i1~~c21080_g1_i1.p1  ORF type:complete len:422 (-),score=173.13 c21080_g1_i1:117-1382(-)